jgi:hypothetical protein
VNDLEWSPGTWRKSTASGVGNCVEVSFADSSVLMRHSQSPHGPVLSFSRPEWDAFLTGVRGGEFDTDSPPPTTHRDGRIHPARLGEFTARTLGQASRTWEWPGRQWARLGRSRRRV